MGPRYSRFLGSPIGSDLELQQGLQAVTTEASALGPRTARGSIGATSLPAFVEFFVYGSSSDITDLVYLGLATSLIDVESGIAETDQALGYNLSSGEILHDGIIGSGASGGIGSVVGVLLTWGDTPQVTFFVDGELVDTVDIPASMLGVPLYYAVALGSTDAGDIIVFANTGDRQPTYTNPVADSWQETPDVPPDLRISTQDYVTGPGDSPPNAAFDGVIAASSAVLTRRMSFWPWGEDPLSSKSSLVLTVDNTNGRFNSLIGGRYRDLPVRLREVEEGADLSTAVTLGTFLFDRAELIEGGQARLTMIDDTVLLEKPSQRRLFPPNAVENAANRPWPTLIGSYFSIPLVNFADDGTHLDYAIDSEGIAFAGKVRDKGDPWDPTASPTPDYTIIDNGTTLRTPLTPLGIVTMDASMTGGEYVPPAPVDLMGGIGDPFDSFPIMIAPDGWTTGGTQPPVHIGSGVVEFPYVVNDVGNMTATGITTAAATTYRYRLVIDQMTTRIDSTSIGSRIGIGYTSSLFAGFDFFEPFPGQTYPVVREGLVTPGAGRDIYITHQNSNQVGGDSTLISEFTMIEIPTGDTSETDDEIEAAQPALSLELTIAELFRRTARPDEFWSRSSVAAIDTATESAGGGYYSQGQYSDRDALRALLPGYNATCYKDEEGVLQFARMVAPELEIATHTLDVSQMQTELLPSFDAAPGLTTRIVCRPNGVALSDGELVTDEVEVTMALRRKLARPYRFERSAGTQVAAGYEHAISADPLETTQVNPTDAQNRIEEVAGIYSRSRAFYQATVAWQNAPPMAAITLVTYPDFGMDAGVNLQCIEVQPDITEERSCVVTFWGLSPEELESEGEGT